MGWAGATSSPEHDVDPFENLLQVPAGELPGAPLVLPILVTPGQMTLVAGTKAPLAGEAQGVSRRIRWMI